MNSLDRILSTDSSRRHVRKQIQNISRPLQGTAYAAQFLRWARQVRLGQGSYADWDKSQRVEQHAEIIEHIREQRRNPRDPYAAKQTRHPRISHATPPPGH